MHDLKFANEIIAVLKQELAKSGRDAKPQRIVVNVVLSPFSHVTPEGLDATFKELVALEKMANVSLNIRPMEFDMYCGGCNSVSKISAPVFNCPKCNSADTDIQIQKEFFVDSIELDN